MRLLNELFENPSFQIDEDSLGYLVRDIINMNWWNTAGVLTGYARNKRMQRPFTEEQKRIAVQLKEYYRHNKISICDEDTFRREIKQYIAGTRTKMDQLSSWSMRSRANPSQYFHRPDGTMTWVDCTSRATYAAKYVYQNGFIDWDGVCRVKGVSRVLQFIRDGVCEDLGISHLFEDGNNAVKAEIFSQKSEQRTVEDWVRLLGIKIVPSRQWLYDAISHVRTDPYKAFEAACIAAGVAEGVNECLYGLKTMASVGTVVASDTSHASDTSRASSASNASTASNASDASRASTASYASTASNASDASRASTASYASTASGVSDASTASRASRASTASDASNASDASRASTASDASYASRASTASDASSASRVSDASYASYASTASGISDTSYASDASRASSASGASNASRASDAGTTTFDGSAWSECKTAITKPEGLEYPPHFRKNIFAIAGSWKIDKAVVHESRLGWFDPFSGHGTSPLYAARHGIKYVGFDTNKAAFDAYLGIVASELPEHVTLRCHDSTVFVRELVGQFDLCYTSPPYFDFEEYGGNTAHFDGCASYADFHARITVPVFRNVYEYLVDGGVVALQVGKQKKDRQGWIDALTSCGFALVDSRLTGQEANKYSAMSKRDQSLLVFRR
jgi:hypothetical protein